MLFVRQSTESSAIWEGPKLSKEDASAISGIENIYWATSFESVLRKVMAGAETVFLNIDHHPGRALGPIDKNLRFAHWCKETYPLHQYHNASPVLNKLRAIKSPDEIALIRKSCEITRAAFEDACKVIRPGIYEYEIEAEFSRTILRHGARGFAYEPIVASGANSCVLHYISNDRKCEADDIVLMDVGASYANYASDMTRTVPVSGRFSSRQRQVYDAVLEIFRNAVPLLAPGMAVEAYHSHVAALADKALAGLGLASTADLRSQNRETPARSKHFPHRTSHHLGLDVHDSGTGYDKFEPGMVVTCEPGIYIRDEGFGIRIENDILITDTGNEDLLASAPIEAEDIESLVRGS
jgi:Xaa-Pro aminopeptidase